MRQLSEESDCLILEKGQGAVTLAGLVDISKSRGQQLVACRCFLDSVSVSQVEIC